MLYHPFNEADSIMLNTICNVLKFANTEMRILDLDSSEILLKKIVWLGLCLLLVLGNTNFIKEYRNVIYSSVSWNSLSIDASFCLLLLLVVGPERLEPKYPFLTEDTGCSVDSVHAPFSLYNSQFLSPVFKALLQMSACPSAAGKTDLHILM